MNPIRYLGVALVFFVLGCQGMPTVTRSGDVKDIIIGDNLTLTETAVNAGDEVRWINKRNATCPSHLSRRSVGQAVVMQE